MAESFKALSKAEICEINKQAIANFGVLYVAENHNLLNPDRLDYILEAIFQPVFDVMLYKTTYDKIAAIMQTVYAACFYGCNKRAGLACLVALAARNAFKFRPTKEVEDFIVAIAKKSLAIGEAAQLLKKRLG